MIQSIVFVRSNPVNPDSRVEKQAWSLAKTGYQVKILAWDRDSNHKAVQEHIQVAGVALPIVRIGYRAGFGEGMKSLWPFIKFQLSIFRWICRNRKKIDIIHACDFDTAFTSFIAAKICRKKTVFDVFDFLYGEPKGLFQQIINRIQKWLVNISDGTIICTEERQIQIAGTHPHRITVIHNTPFIEQMKVGQEYLLPEYSNRIKIVYVGILADERLLTAIGHYFSLHPQYEFHIAGFGVLHEYYQKLSESSQNIVYYGRISYSQALSLENQCDIMLAIYDPSDENCRHAAPNKFYESLMLGKPVIMAKNTGMSSVVEKNRIGVLIDFSEEGFSKGIDELVKQKERWAEISLSMKSIYERDYSWNEMYSRLIAFYSSL